ncbi:hypothetical protein PVNG_03051 [Plasmodium vivax North Korean]|uniref:Uncharacterized protein n=1 Tax=Plasmodium vivax North Korean TaxID=1035514 RepID=A0A0J9WEN0_PLAVI|nr:hypothetical protein PVNG_03051 [Plasmodium vivax North Korean]
MNKLAVEKPTTGMKKSENKKKCVSSVSNPPCSNNIEEGGSEVKMSSKNDSKKKNASTERQSSAKKGNDTKSGGKKSSGGTGSAEAKDKCSLTVSAQVVESAAVPAEGEAEMATQAEAKKDAKGSAKGNRKDAKGSAKENAKDAKGNPKVVKTIAKVVKTIAKDVKTIAKDAKGTAKNAKLNSKDTTLSAKDAKPNAKDAKPNAKDAKLNAKDTKLNAKDTKLNVKDRGAPKPSPSHNAKQKSSGSPPGKNAPVKLSPPKKSNSKEVASAESTSVAAARHSAHAQMNQKETEQINLNRDKKKVSEMGEKRTNKGGRVKSCKARNEEHQSKKQKSNTIKKKKKLSCSVINEIQVRNNIYICKFKNKLNKIRKYFFPIYKYGEASIARNKAVLLKIHMHTCLYCQNGVLCNFVENYTL